MHSIPCRWEALDAIAAMARGAIISGGIFLKKHYGVQWNNTGPTFRLRYRFHCIIVYFAPGTITMTWKGRAFAVPAV